MGGEQKRRTDIVKLLRRQVEQHEKLIQGYDEDRRHADYRDQDYWAAADEEEKEMHKKAHDAADEEEKKKMLILKKLVPLEEEMVDNLMKMATDMDSRLAEITKEVFREAFLRFKSDGTVTLQMLQAFTEELGDTSDKCK